MLSDAARAAMRAYDWPGNVRELANAVERAVICAEADAIAPEDLPMDEAVVVPARDQAAALRVEVENREPRTANREPPPGSIVLPPDLRDLAAIEAMVIRAAIAESGGQKSKAAERLGINRTTLYNKLKDLGVEGGEAAG